MDEPDYNDIKIIIDNDDIYPKNGWGRKIFNRVFWLPMVRYLPKKFGSRFFIGSCEYADLVVKHATTFKALEIMYGHNGFVLNGNGLLDSIFTWFWQSTILNAQAVRNRLELVKKELEKIILEKNKDGQPEIKILSLASGSARAVIEVMAKLKDSDIKIKARFVDVSRDALNFSRELAQKRQIIDRIETVRANITNLNKACSNWQPDIVEVVGLMDYLDDKAASELIKKIYKHINSNGQLIFSNINHNPEKRFVSDIVNWHQIYRSPHQLGELLLAGGFNPRHCRIIREPLGIQTVAIGTKPEHP